MPFLLNVLRNVGVSLTKGGAARLEDGRAAVGSDLYLACGVAQKERKGHGLTLYHASPWRQHLSDAPYLGYLALSRVHATTAATTTRVRGSLVVPVASVPKTR